MIKLQIHQLDNHNWRNSYLPYELFGEVEVTLHRLGIGAPILRLPDLEEIGPWLMVVACAHTIIQDYRKRSQTAQIITFCIVDESKIRNALATALANGSYCIVITVSMLGFLISMSEAFLSRPPLQKLFALKKNVKRFFKTATPGVRISRAVTHESAAQFGAIGLHMAVFMAILYHELGHIVNGHLGLIGDEVEGLSGLELKQVLEFDADCTAVVEMLSQIGRGYLVPASASVFCRTEADRNRFALLATHLMFRAFAEENNPIEDWTHLNAHMPPEHRSIFIRHAICNILERTNNLRPRFIEESILYPVVYAVELAAIQLTGRTELQRRYDRSFDELAGFQSELLRRWAIVRPQLEPHKLGSHDLAEVQELPSGKGTKDKVTKEGS